MKKPELVIPGTDTYTDEDLPPVKEIVSVGSAVIVKKLKREKSKGGVIIPNTHNPADGSEGIVVAVGSGYLKQDGGRVPCTAQVGDRVIVGHRVVELEIEGVRYHRVDDGDILAILR